MPQRKRKGPHKKAGNKRLNEEAAANARAAAGISDEAPRGPAEEFGPFAPADHPIDERGQSQGRYHPNESDRVIVITLAGEGIPQDVIARTLNQPHGISVESLAYHYGRELLTARGDLLSRGWARVIATMNNPAHKDSFKAAAFMITRLSHFMPHGKNGPALPPPGGEDPNAGLLAGFAGADVSRLAAEGRVTFTLKIGEGEPLDADKIGTRETLDLEATDVTDLSEAEKGG